MNRADRDAIANDWKAVGDDIRVVLGMKRCKSSKMKVDFWDAFVNGVVTLNPFGTDFGQKCR